MAIYFALAAIVVIAAAAVCFVLWQKMQVDRQKIKSDLYNRRFAAVVALGNAVDGVGKPIIADDFAAKSADNATDYPERPGTHLR